MRKRSRFILVTAAITSMLSFGCTAILGISDVPDPSSTTEDGSTADGSTTDSQQNGTDQEVAEASTGCAPSSMSGFDGGNYRPPDFSFAGLCTQAQTDIYGAAFSSCQNDAGCNEPDAGNPTCLNCVETVRTATKWGPFITPTLIGAGISDVSLNVPGCVANVLGEGSSLTGCGAKLQNADDCVHAACAASCALLDGGPTEAQISACESAAAAGPCASFVALTAPCDSGAASTCFKTTTESESAYVSRVVGVFCTGGGDGG